MSVTILTSRLALVSRRAAVWHLQVGLAATAVLHRFWGLCRRRWRAREVGKTATQLFCNRDDSRNLAQAKWQYPESHRCPPLTFVLHHVGLHVVPMALQRVARLLQAADDGLRRAAAVAVVDGAGGGARAGWIPGGSAGRVSRGGAESVGGQVEGRVHRLLFVLQTVRV